VLAIVVDYAGVLAINAWEPAAELVYKPIYAGLTAVLALAIVLIATALSSWKTLQTKPMEVLRYE
jgi:ABC-type lipoprotein release transport system permease subunit